MNSFIWFLYMQNKTLAHYTGYKSSDMKKCILALRDLQVNTKNCPLKAIRFKYWHNKVGAHASKLY